MDQQLQRALELHQQNRLDQALEAYEAILQRETPPLQAFMNPAAIWRSQEKQAKAIECLKRGLTHYPSEPGLWNNLGNCHMDNGAITLAVVAFRQALTQEENFTDSRISLATCLRELGHANLAYSTVKDKFCRTTNETERQKLMIPLVESLLSLASSDKNSLCPEDLEPMVELVEAEVKKNIGEQDPARAGLLMTQLWIQINQLDRALESREKLIESVNHFFAQPNNKNTNLKKSFHTQWHGLNWNLGIKCLKLGRLKEGWSLYEHGLQVPAEGAQRWQRSLKKPFTPSEIPFWRGESLLGKRILLMGEQGIGDSMMFASLIPKLQKEGANITLFPGDRLLKIYQRSLPDIKIISTDDLVKQRTKPNDFDFQSPLGSICQYRFTDLKDYGPRRHFLKADPDQVQKLRQRYHDGRPLIGISWQGGGKANRIPMKSLKLQQLTPILNKSEFRFVSLQYGDDGPHLERYQKSTGIEVLHDDTIDPLRDMDGWLSQVAAMDAVISIANTTIHGAGGLGIPTLCLVSQQSDWRWIDPSIFKGCYWYPSVDATYQMHKAEWTPAIAEAYDWLQNQTKCLQNT